jgi:hypothetical protein
MLSDHYLILVIHFVSNEIGKHFFFLFQFEVNPHVMNLPHKKSINYQSYYLPNLVFFPFYVDIVV